MKTNPSVLLAGCLLYAGCLPLGRPPVAPPGDLGQYRTELGTPVNTTQVTPRVNSGAGGNGSAGSSSKVLRPESSSPAHSTPDPTVLPPPGERNTIPDRTDAPPKPDSPAGSIPPETPPITDAPLFEPLPAPGPDNSSAPSANQNRVEFGQAGRFPALRAGVAPLSEVSRSEKNGEKDQESLWMSEFLSAGQRPIQTLRHAGQAPPVLIIGSLYGNEPESVALIDQVITELSRVSDIRSELVFVRSANPDGLAEHIRTNLRGVDLNRNFPSTLFTANPSQQTGPQPGSEPETQALMRILMGAAPVRVVHVRSTVGSRPLVLVNNALQSRLSDTSVPDFVDWDTFHGGFKAGSLEEYVSVRMSAESMTILLPPQGFPSLTPHQLLQLSLLGIDTGLVKSGNPAPQQPPQNPTLSTTNAPSNAETTPRQNETGNDSADSVIRPGAKGYVEILPSPPSADVADPHASRYFELPPPPR